MTAATESAGGASAPWRPAPARWMARRGLLARIGLAMVAGAGITLGQAPVDLPWALFIALPVIVWLLDAAEGPWRAALTGWAAGFGMFVSGLHWMGHAFLVDPEKFAWLMPFAVTLLPAGLGIFWGAAAALARALWRPGHWSRVIVLAAALAAAEWLRSTILTGFPWSLPAYVWTETPVAQAAAWIGPHGLTLLTIALAALPLAAGPRHPAAWGALAAVAILWGAGMARLAGDAQTSAHATVLRIVQPNAAQHLKWQPGHRERFEARLMELSAAPPGPVGKPDAVIWPETAVTFLAQDAPARMAALAASANGALLVTGGLFYEQAPSGLRRWSNSLMAVRPDGQITERYDKHHLVPFGEYLPLADLLGRIGLEALASMGRVGFEPGPGPRRLELPGLPPVAPAICYEMIFPTEVIPSGPRPDWILHLTNDAWFGNFAGPQQHLAQSRFRAIEQGLPVVRAANTGISAVIDARGRVLSALPLATHGAIDAALPPPRPPTLYARTGDWPGLAAMAALLAVAALSARRQTA